MKAINTKSHANVQVSNQIDLNAVTDTSALIKLTTEYIKVVDSYLESRSQLDFFKLKHKRAQLTKTISNIVSQKPQLKGLTECLSSRNSETIRGPEVLTEHQRSLNRSQSPTIQNYTTSTFKPQSQKQNQHERSKIFEGQIRNLKQELQQLITERINAQTDLMSIVDQSFETPSTLTETVQIVKDCINTKQEYYLCLANKYNELLEEIEYLGEQNTQVIEEMNELKLKIKILEKEQDRLSTSSS